MKNIFKKSGAIAATGIALSIMGASAASAATFDFVAMADVASDVNFIGSTEGNWADLKPAGVTIGGITLKASGSNVDNNGFADAFFDKGNAGLGVCSTELGCATGGPGNTGDDNVSGTAGGETLTLDFGQFVDLSDLVFNSGNHPPLTGSLTVNGGILTVAGGLVTSGANYLMNASVFNFSFTGDQFYLATATAEASQGAPVVPLPAGAVLLLTGLGAMGAMSRRRKNAAA